MSVRGEGGLSRQRCEVSPFSNWLSTSPLLQTESTMLVCTVVTNGSSVTQKKKLELRLHDNNDQRFFFCESRNVGVALPFTNTPFSYTYIHVLGVREWHVREQDRSDAQFPGQILHDSDGSGGRRRLERTLAFQEQSPTFCPQIGDVVDTLRIACRVTWNDDGAAADQCDGSVLQRSCRCASSGQR